MNFLIIFFSITSIILGILLLILKEKDKSKCPDCYEEMLECGFRPNSRYECRNKDCPSQL